ncbi:hypothetical protein PESP_a0485 [Pseudoalteromonas espejiana DSM 9414]|uniref:Glycosyl transferase n=1 Tax=Pseudoalteromonas espejiana TaxID=28107 RepID=A0A510Y134_9GAMM|nr:glycosyltransferase [Pseudoalteromonas espejiana]ASM48729.1 hypothetical protein PESP_a0485 [Pseudoalteromonas espejiana DSM 9414]GEK57026.1 hypothetical protein PES01_38710 [Pseudoalteromonas espejiana]
MEKIAFIINSFGGGGAEKVTQQLLEYILSTNSAEIHLVLLNNDDIEYELPSQVIVHRLGGKSIRYVEYFLLLWKALKLANLLSANKIDHSISMLFRANVCNVMSKLFGNKNQIVISERSFSNFNSGNNLLINKLITFFYSKADRIIAISHGIKESLVSDFHLNASKIIVIHNPVKLNRYSVLPVQKENVEYISVGRLISLKNHELLIKAFSACVDINPKAKLIILGDGPLKEKLQGLVCSLSLQNHVTLTGFVENPGEYLKQSDIFVFSSLVEGFGNAITEAMSYGLPVISTNCPSGPSEILSGGDYGVLVKNDNVEELSRSMIKLMESLELRQHYSLMSQKRVLDFEISKIAEKYIKTIR